MSDIIVALIAFAGTALGSITGILSANKLTTYRISQLEQKVNKHNNLIERMTIVERDSKSHQHQIDELKEEVLRL